MKNIFFLLILILNSIVLHAQNTIGLPLIINYSKTDYRGGTQTWDIEQDRNGILYFANNEGLLTYDGIRWKIYPMPNKTIMRSLAIDADGRIYVGGQGEMGYFIANKQGALQYISLVTSIPVSQSKFADIWDIEIFNGAVFFRATDRIFELKNNIIQAFLPHSEWQFLKKIGNELFAYDTNTGLMNFNDNQWHPLYQNNILKDETISGIIQKGKDSLLLTTVQKNLFTILNDSVFKTKVEQTALWNKINIYKSIQINENEFAAATSDEGCDILNVKGEIIQNISRNEGLQNNSVLFVFLDKDKNLWVGLNNGISFIAYNSAIKYIKPSRFDELSGFSSKIFNQQLYIATSNGLYSAPLSYENKDFSFSKSAFSLIKNTTGQAWRLDEVNQQLILGQNSGAYVIKNNEAIQISQTPSWLFIPLSAVLPSKNIIVGTYTGLSMFGFDKDQFFDLGNLDGVYESFRFLTIDNNNNIWASHPYRGIYKLNLSNDAKKYSAELFTDKDGLPSALGNHVFKIKGRVVFATEKGVYEFDDSAKKFIPSASLTPIFGNLEIRYLNEDNDGDIWFCDGKKLGVVHFNKDNPAKPFNITYFPELMGHILSGFENIYPFDKKNIFIGSEKGVIHLNYEKYISNKNKIPVLLGEVKAIGSSDSIIYGGYQEPVKPSTDGASKENIIHLPISYNSFHFEFSSPSFGQQNNIEYSYQLEGYDRTWSAWSSKTEKDYTNLPEGSYTFHIKAHDNLENESDTVSYSFIIEPAWYKTNWAYLIYILFFITIVYFANKWQKRKFYLQQLKFEAEQKKLRYIHDLELEKNEKEIIKLQNEKLASEVLLKNKELANTSMHLVENSDAILKVKEELKKIYSNASNGNELKKVINLLNDAEKSNANWEQFASHFDEINDGFIKKLKIKFPNLSNSDIKICTYLKLNMSTKEIAQLINISARGVEISRYRLRKKLNLRKDQSLNDFLNF